MTKMKCDLCKSPAAYNIQTGVMVWKVSRNGNYSRTPIELQADDETNSHFCDEHYEKYNAGEIDIDGEEM